MWPVDLHLPVHMLLLQKVWLWTESTADTLKMWILAGTAWNFPHWPVTEDIRCNDSYERFPQVGDHSSLNFMDKIIRRRIIMQSHFISDSHQLQWLELTGSCRNIGRCSPLQQYVFYVSVWNPYVWWCMPAAEQTFAPDYWHVLLNVMLEHRCSIQVWREREEAPPFVRVWRTHAIPHIYSISDCITEALLTFSDIRRG